MVDVACAFYSVKISLFTYHLGFVVLLKELELAQFH